MGWVIHDFDIENRCQTAQTLSTDTQIVNRIHDLETQLFDAVLWTTLTQLVNIDWVHQRLFRHHSRFLSSTTNTYAEHTRWTPACTHGRYSFHNPIYNRVRRVKHHHLRFVLRTATFRCNLYINGIAFNDFVVNHRWRVVFGVLTLARRISQDRGTQHVIRMVVSATHTFVDHIGHAHCGIPLHVHTDLNEHGNDTGILAERALTLCTHARVNQNLRHRILSGWVLLFQIGLMHALHKIDRMVVGDKLQRISNAVNQVVLANHAHGGVPL